jgi:hypothetical protein
MKKVFHISSVFIVAALLHSACSKKIDDVYKNPNANVRVPVETLLPGIISNMHSNFSAQGTSYGTANDGLYVGRYVQYWATNTVGNQYDQMGGATGISDVLGAVWAAHYYGMGQNLERMIEWSIEEKKWDYVGVGLAIRAWSWLTLTDMHGEVILGEAFNPSQLTFKYDEQQAVYDTVRSLVRQAISYLSMTGDGVSQQNLAKGDAYFYEGDVEKWKKYAYSVMARSFHRTTNKSDYKPDSVLFYANLAINTNADNAIMKFANTGISGTSNFFGPLRSNMGLLRQSAFIANLVNGDNSTFPDVEDPRGWYLIRENNNGTLRGINPNKGTSGLSAADRPRNFWGQGWDTTTSPTNDSKGRYLFKNGVPFPIITASEIQFMKAEAYYRKDEKASALASYIDGINLSFELLTTLYGDGVPADKVITPTMQSDFIGDPVIVPTADNLTLSHIMLQKYIALYGYGAVETWVDMRRYHYVDSEPGQPGQVYADFVPPSGLDLFANNNNKVVYRARPRYNSEYLYNVAELEKLGGLALDYNTKEQWFSINQ